MRATRLLPPLLLVGILGVIAWRAAERPQREAIQKTIRARWMEPGGRRELVEEVSRYLDRYHNEEDRKFAAHALLRARDPARAVRARWADLDRPLPPAEVKAFAEDALFWLGWDDEPAREAGLPAGPGTRPSPANIQCLMALLEGNNPLARKWLEERVRSQPIDEVYTMMRRSRALANAEARPLVARAARERAAAERAHGLPTEDWDVITALLTPKTESYPEREADIDLLIQKVKSDWRVQGIARWVLACRALGELGEQRGLDALREVEALLTGSNDPKDQRDLAIVRIGLLFSGDWSQDALLRPLIANPGAELTTVRANYQEAILFRWRAGDKYAVEPLTWLWEGLGGTDLSVRERLGRVLLIEGPPPNPDVPVERLLAGLEAPDAPASLMAIAKAYRLRRGDPGAREVLLRWLGGEGSADMTAGSSNPEQALSPPIAGLRALYLYD